MKILNVLYKLHIELCLCNIHICKVHLMALEFKFFKYFLFKLICLTLNNRTAELYVDVTNINLEISYNYTWRRLQLFTWRRLKLQKHCLQLHMTSTTTIHAMSTTTKCDANFNFTGRRLQVHVTSTATSRGVDYNYTWLQPSSSFDLTHLLLLRIFNIPLLPIWTFYTQRRNWFQMFL